MKFALFLLWAGLALAAAPRDFPFDLEGHWEGAFVRDGAAQEVLIDLYPVGNTEEPITWGGRYSIPEAGMYGRALDSISYVPPELRFKLNYGLFVMVVDTAYHEITGTNDRWGPPLRIHLKRREAEPRTFLETRARWSSGPDTLAGTLFLPVGAAPHATVILMHGALDTTREVWSYRSLGEILARQGYAALAYDKRGYGESTGDPDPGLEEQAADALAAIAYLKRRPEIDARRLVLLGSSQSGWSAVKVAARSQDLLALVLHSTPAVSVEKQEQQRVAYTLRQEEQGEAVVDSALRYTNLFFDAVRDSSRWPELAAAIPAARQASWAGQFDFPGSPGDLQWFRENAYDPAADLRKVRIPVLALYGGNDPLVPPAENAALLERLLTEGGNWDVTVWTFPQGSHLIERYGTLRSGKWEWPEGYWAFTRKCPGYYEALFEWLAAHVRR